MPEAPKGYRGSAPRHAGGHQLLSQSQPPAPFPQQPRWRRWGGGGWNVPLHATLSVCCGWVSDGEQAPHCDFSADVNQFQALGQGPLPMTSVCPVLTQPRPFISITVSDHRRGWQGGGGYHTINEKSEAQGQGKDLPEPQDSKLVPSSPASRWPV